jgi:hypothetical protein
MNARCRPIGRLSRRIGRRGRNLAPLGRCPLSAVRTAARGTFVNDVTRARFVARRQALGAGLAAQRHHKHERKTKHGCADRHCKHTSFHEWLHIG